MELGLAQRRQSGGPRKVQEPLHGRRTPRPGWADGLRRLYDSVVDEELPDSFEDLLKRLDRAGDDRA